MTDTLSSPLPPPSLPPPGPAARPAARPGLLRAGLPAAAWAFGAGMVVVAVPVLVLWAADSRSGAGAGAALRAVAAVWLLAHGASLEVPGGTFGLTPLALFALPLLLLERAARSAAGSHQVRTLPDAARLAAGVAGPYALALTGLAWLAAGAQVRPDAAEALLGASLLGLAGAGTGVLRGAALLPPRERVVPARLRRTAPLVAGALAALLGAGALLVGLALAADLGQARELAAASSPGVIGGLGLLGVGLLLAPVAVVWGASYLAGPGFAVGVGTAVGPFAVVLGPVPALPLLAGLPGGPLPAGVGVLALAVPAAAGLLTGRLARRRGARWTDALLAGPLTGAAMAGLAALSAGPVGGGRLSQVGPSWPQVGVAVALEVTLGAVVGWAVSARRARADRSRDAD